jgi:hypothetical protein
MTLDAFRKELHDFDGLRVLPAWDGLVAKQQTALESQSVPTMAMTTVPRNREVRFRIEWLCHAQGVANMLAQRQQKVIQVLEGILG